MPKNQVMPGDEDRSPKQHQEMPPKDTAPHGAETEEGRGEGRSGEVGQFTGGGRTPGMQKK